jgi:hypothetical protein
VPVWYEAPLEMNEGTPWVVQGYNRLHSRSAVDRPNIATFKPLIQSSSMVQSIYTKNGKNKLNFMFCSEDSSLLHVLAYRWDEYLITK